MNINTVMFNGALMDINEIKISPFNRAFQMGDGVFEIVPVIDGKPAGLKMAMEHLFASSVQIKLPAVYMVDEMCTFVHELVEAGEMKDGVVFCMFTRGEGHGDADFPEQSVPELIMQLIPCDRKQQAELRKSGVNLISVEDTRGSKCSLNVLGRLPEIMAKHTAGISRCFDALFTRDGKATETTESSLILVKDEILWTYPTGDFIHDNLIKEAVKEIAGANDVPLLEKAFTVDFALKAEEAFICDPENLIMPVVKIDRRPVGDGKPGKVTAALLEEFLKKVASED